MGWKFWKREQTEAERSLAALQQQAASPSPAPAAAPVADAVTDAEIEAEIERRMRPAMEHMERIGAELAATLGLPPGESGSFMLEVTGLEVQADGSVALVGGAHEGDVEPGQVVGAVVLPEGLTHADPSLSDRESAEQLIASLLGARALTATVVSWDAAVPRLVVTDVGPGDLTVGSMISR